MATAQDIVRAGLRKANVTSSGVPPTADEATDGLEDLNDMIASWEAKDVFTGITTLALTDTVPLDNKHIGGLKALLAVKMSADYGTQISPVVKAEAFTAWQLIKADFFNQEELRCDDALAYSPSQRRFW